MLVLSFKKNTFKIFMESLKILQRGGIVAYPTESFYALGALATDEKAIKRLYELKKRPSGKPLPVIVGDIDILKPLVKYIPSQAERLMEKFWPGPLTLIFEARDNISKLLTGGTGKIAIRIPGESVALQLVKAVRLPLTATSANLSSKPPAKKPDEVISYFKNGIDLIIDAGKTPGGKPSTIVDVTVTPLRVLREGPIVISTTVIQ